jgi:hypothetical protein
MDAPVRETSEEVDDIEVVHEVVGDVNDGLNDC